MGVIVEMFEHKHYFKKSGLANGLMINV